MCANYESVSPEFIEARGWSAPDSSYSRDIYPGKIAPVLINEEGGHVRPGCFGLVPWPWGTLKLARQTYNCRNETAATKPSFRNAWKHRRLAIIPVNAFYEPCYESGKPERWRIERTDAKPFGLAGIWEFRFEDTSIARWSFSMLTINATGHPLMSRFHAPEDEKRSVVVIDDDDWTRYVLVFREHQ